MGLYSHWDESGGVQVTGIAWGQVRSGRAIDRAGTAQGGAAGYITLDAGAPPDNDSFKSCWCAITAGQGSGQIKPAAASSWYDGVLKRFSINGTFSPVPDPTSVFRLFLARKYAVSNADVAALASVVASLEVFGDSDGVQYPRWALDASTLSCPFNVAAAVGGTGGVWGATGVRYYRLTGVKGSGETTGSVEISASVDATTKKVTLTWDALPGSPDNIKVYRSDTPGVYTTPALRATVSGGDTTYLDDGSAVGSGALPAANTTGGAAASPYGVPPTLNSAADLSIGTLARGQQKFYWEQPLVAAGHPRRTVGWARRFQEA